MYKMSNVVNVQNLKLYSKFPSYWGGCPNWRWSWVTRKSIYIYNTNILFCGCDNRFLGTLSADGALWQLFIALTNAAFLLPSVLSLACHLHLLPAFMCSGLVHGSVHTVLSGFSRCWHYALNVNLPLTVRATSCSFRKIKVDYS